MGRRTLCAWSAIAIAVAACGGDAFVQAPNGDGGSDGGTSSSSDGGSVSADQACQDLATNVCGRLQACAPFLIQAEFGDLSTCVRREELICPTLQANGTGASAANLEACAQAYPATLCVDVASNRPPSACNFQGTLAAGSACASASQCAGASARCSAVAGQKCGVCATRQGAGQACSMDNDCQAGMVCSQATATCLVPGAQGASCDATHPCVGTLACNAGACALPLGAGVSCTAQNCDAARGLYCNPRTNVCAQIQVAASGAPCGTSAVTGALTSCGASAKCKIANGSAAGTCEAPAADGASCDASNGPPCLPPAACVNGLCTLPDPSACH